MHSLLSQATTTIEVTRRTIWLEVCRERVAMITSPCKTIAVANVKACLLVLSVIMSVETLSLVTKSSVRHLIIGQ